MDGPMHLLLIIPGIPGWTELIVIAFVGLLLFGRRLPDVGRSLGRSIVEFKRGLNDVRGDLDRASDPDKAEKKILPPAGEPSSGSSTESDKESVPSEPESGATKNEAEASTRQPS